jgi:hypothetical protein
MKNNPLVAVEMKLKTLNRRVHFVHWELQDAGRRNVPPVQVLLYLIPGLIRGGPHSVRRHTIRAVESSIRPVMAFVHVFVHVLDGADAVADLDIDVTIVFQEEIRIRHHPAVVQ